jgi:MFS family permease
MSEASKKRWALGLTSLGAFLVVMDSQVMTVALATIRSDLHASYEALQWTLNAYTLTFAVLLLTGAALGDRFGRRRNGAPPNCHPELVEGPPPREPCASRTIVRISSDN